VVNGTARTTLAAVLGVCLLQTPGCATPHEVAQTSLDDLRKLNVAATDADENAFTKDIGFNSVEEVADAQLGPPIRIYKVPLDLLQKFQPSDDPNQLLVDTGRIIFPLTVKGQSRSSFTVTESSLTLTKGWKGLNWKSRVTRTGFPRLIRKIEQLKPSSSSFLVLIMPLRLFLLGDRKEGRLLLTAIEANPHFKLNEGDERDAAELFVTLAPDAKIAYETDQYINREVPGMAIPDRPNTERAPPAY